MMKGRFSQESYLLIPGYGFEIVENQPLRQKHLLTFTCAKSTTETLEKGVKHVRS